MSAQPCGCDPEEHYQCEAHRAGVERAPGEGETRPNGFIVKDSGKRENFSNGMVRDTSEGKTDYSLILDGPMFDRWAVHLTKGAVKYSKRNWMLAEGERERVRFKESALRHFLQWYRGETDEDHAAAVYFNINGAEYVTGRLRTNLAGGVGPEPSSSIDSDRNTLRQRVPRPR